MLYQPIPSVHTSNSSRCCSCTTTTIPQILLPLVSLALILTGTFATDLSDQTRIWLKGIGIGSIATSVVTTATSFFSERCCNKSDPANDYAASQPTVVRTV